MTMTVAYYAVKKINAGGVYEPGDLIPEAGEWPGIAIYLSRGMISPVLVATLPKSARDYLAEWEAEKAAQPVPADPVVEWDKQKKAEYDTKVSIAAEEVAETRNPFVPQYGTIDITNTQIPQQQDPTVGVTMEVEAEDGNDDGDEDESEPVEEGSEEDDVNAPDDGDTHEPEEAPVEKKRRVRVAR
jgi:hypothetical protein